MIMSYLAYSVKYNEVSSVSVTSFKRASRSSMITVDENQRTTGARLPLLPDGSHPQSNTLLSKNTLRGGLHSESIKRRKLHRQKHSDTGNRTPGYRVRGDNVSHYTISD
jgi:hypothetical protein